MNFYKRMIKAKILILIYTSLTLIKACPTEEEVGNLGISPDNVSFFQSYVQQNRNKSISLSDFCVQQVESNLIYLNALTRYEKTSNQYKNTKDWALARLIVEICMNGDNKKSPHSYRGQTKSPIVSIIKADTSRIVFQMFGEVPINTGQDLIKETVIFNLDGFPGSDKPEILREKYRKYENLQQKGLLGNAFEAPCNGSEEQFGYKNWLITKPKGLTFKNYLNRLKSNSINDLHDRLGEYIRMAELLLKLEEKGIAFCQFSPDTLQRENNGYLSFANIDSVNLNIRESSCEAKKGIFTPPEFSLNLNC